MLLAEHTYYYGAGCAPNRRIQFFGDGARVWADVHAKECGQWHHTGTVAEAAMRAEACPLDAKLDMVRRGLPLPRDTPLGDLAYGERVALVAALGRAHGERRLQLAHGVGTHPRFEVVERIVFLHAPPTGLPSPSVE